MQRKEKKEATIPILGNVKGEVRILKTWSLGAHISEEKALTSYAGSPRPLRSLPCPDLWWFIKAQKKKRSLQSWIQDLWQVGALQLVLVPQEFIGHSLSPDCWGVIGCLSSEWQDEISYRSARIKSAKWNQLPEWRSIGGMILKRNHEGVCFFVPSSWLIVSFYCPYLQILMWILMTKQPQHHKLECRVWVWS